MWHWSVCIAQHYQQTQVPGTSWGLVLLKRLCTREL